MASTGQNSNYGFAGLTSLVSDFKGLPSPSAQRPSQPSPAAPTGPDSSQAVPRRSYGRGPLVLVIVLGLIGIIVYANFENGAGSTNSARPTPAASASARNPENMAPPTTQPAANAAYLETEPAAGTNNSLNVNEITYCLAQDARMAAVKPLVDTSSQTAITAFNTLVADFNSRCSQYRYNEADMNHATAAVASHEVELKGQALQWLSTWQGSAKGRRRSNPSQQSSALDSN